MSATVSTDFAFEPKVWKEHVAAFFRDKLVFGAIAMSDDTLTAQPGETINFPFFTKIGDAEEPAETDSLSVDNLADDSFSATVKEVGKAVGVKKRAFKVSAARTERIIEEVASQIGRVIAENVDDTIYAEMSTVGNFIEPSLASYTGKNVRALNAAKVLGFGDLHTDAIALQINSMDMLDVMNDSTAGLLKADATDPLIDAPGFRGRMLGMAVFEVDKTPAGTAWIHKVDPYGFIIKQDMELDVDFDILAREWVWAGNQWYAAKSFHTKISADDRKSTKVTFA